MLWEEVDGGERSLYTFVFSLLSFVKSVGVSRKAPNERGACKDGQKREEVPFARLLVSRIDDGDEVVFSIFTGFELLGARDYLNDHIEIVIGDKKQQLFKRILYNCIVLFQWRERKNAKRLYI